MEILNVVRFIVNTISFVMFCHQLNTATLNLMYPGLVDIKHERDATGDDMPLVTVCPTIQKNITKMRELGYDIYDFMLLGNARCNETTKCTSWGYHRNLTFDELKDKVFDLERVNHLKIYGGEFKNSSVFLPGIGICKETAFLNYTQEIILGHLNRENVRVFITDRSYRSYFMHDTASHVGSKIFMKPNTMYYFNVKIQESFDCKDGKNPKTEMDFKKCVDYKIQNELENNDISCIPPWLSDKNQCKQTYPRLEEFYGVFFAEFNKNFAGLVSILSNILFEEECRQSCKETFYVVNEKGSKKFYGSWAALTFNEKVIVTVKEPNYDMFKYIIDVGSSLGLWLGLSVLGLHDLVVWAVQFVNNNFIIKKIRSAVTK